MNMHNNILNVIEKYSNSKYKFTFVEAILRILDPNIQVLDKTDRYEKIQLFILLLLLLLVCIDVKNVCLTL